jgi:hypothetical protein
MAAQTYTVSESGLVKAPPALVYNLLADYKDGHPHVLPKPYFQTLKVEQGGIGAGTRIYVEMRVMGMTQPFRADVTEPEPGHILVETIPESGLVTTFTVEPLEGGRHAQVTLSTTAKSRGGLLGVVERFMSTRFLRRVYIEELKLIAAVAEERARTASANQAARA